MVGDDQALLSPGCDDAFSALCTWSDGDKGKRKKNKKRNKAPRGQEKVAHLFQLEDVVGGSNDHVLFAANLDTGAEDGPALVVECGSNGAQLGRGESEVGGGSPDGLAVAVADDGLVDVVGADEAAIRSVC